MTRVVIADDHAIVREGLKRILQGQADIEIAGEATNGHEVMDRVRAGGFDMLLLDLSMPGKSGIELIRQVKDERPKLPVLILTMHEEDQYALRAIRAGASGYLTKESAPELLVVHRQDEHAELRPLGLHLLDELDAALAGHRHVEDQHVEGLGAHAGHHLVAVRRLGDDVKVVRRLEQLAQSLAEDRVVVGDDDADGRFRHAGRVD